MKVVRFPLCMIFLMVFSIDYEISIEDDCCSVALRGSACGN